MIITEKFQHYLKQYFIKYFLSLKNDFYYFFLIVINITFFTID